MSYTPVNSDATNVSGYTITRLNATSPSSGAAVSDQSVAIADSYLGAIGFQAQPTAGVLSTQTTSSTTFGSLTGASCTFTAAVAKKYEMQIQISPFMTGAADGIFFRLQNNASTVADNTTNGAMQLFIPAGMLSVYQLMTFVIPVTCVAGSNSLQIQWRLQFGNPGAIAKVDSGSHFVVTVRG